MKRDDLLALNVERAARRAAILCTDLSSGEAQLIREIDAVPGELGEAVAKAFRTGKSAMVEIEDKRLFLTVQVPPPRIVVIGAVHITQALAQMGALAGYDVSIIDPRTAFATEERFGGFDLVADWPEDVLPERPLDAYSALVAVTHDPKIDDYPLIQALQARCFYVGALGSRKTHAKRIERLREAGCSDADIGRIDAPIGLDIGAQSPQEIAVAVLGAIISAFRKRDLG